MKNKYQMSVIVLMLCILYGVSFYLCFTSPLDQLHGEFVKIMYVHAPSAWMGVLLYVLIGLCSIIYLSFSAPIFGIIGYALAPIGMTFTGICLISGMLWGKPIWGTFWVWDARLTSMFILFLLYLGYYLVWDYKEFQIKLASIVSLVGLVNIPIIKFSVYIWNTLHQKSSFIGTAGISIHPSFLAPLLMMFFSSFMLAMVLWYVNTKTIFTLRKMEKKLIFSKFMK